MNLHQTTDRCHGQARAWPRLASLLGCAIALCLTPAGDAGATPGSGVTPRIVAVGVLPDEVRTKLKGHHDDGFGDGTAVEDIMVVEFTIAPGGYFGWHRHGGPVWVVVQAGTLTLYDADDPTCTGTTHGAGSAFLDPGNHVHNARNETGAPVVVYGTFMLPEDGALRVDAVDPGVCPF